MARRDCPSCTGNIDAAECEECSADRFSGPVAADYGEDHYGGDDGWDWPGGYSRSDLLFGGNW